MPPQLPAYPRFIERRLAEALEVFPVVLVQGPRQSGKTTLVQHAYTHIYLSAGGGNLLIGPNAHLIVGHQNYQYISLDDPAASQAAQSDPVDFVDNLPERVILDEAQRAPELFSAIKMQVDRRRVPGRFILTGSSNVLQNAKLKESLAGRLGIIRLHPLSQVEIEAKGKKASEATRDKAPGFLNALFAGRFPVRREARLERELWERIAAGGYPPAIALPSVRDRQLWHDGYVESLISKDVKDLATVRSLDILPKLLIGAVANTATLYNLSDLASPFMQTKPTIENYVCLLENLFLLSRLPPWHSNVLSRLVKSPKLHMCDTGLASTLLGLDAKELASDSKFKGQLLETFVYEELRRQASWSSERMKFFHFRDRDGVEVDMVIEKGKAAIAAVEVKAAATVWRQDFRGLRKLAAAAGERFAGGVVLYDGETCVPFGDRLYAVPIRFLWDPL